MAVTFKAVLASGGTALTILFTTSDTSLYGQTITISKNGTTVGTTAFDNTGNASYTVREAGTYDVVCGAASDQVTVQNEYPVELSSIPDGSTVTPVNDIQTWLNCAGIFNKTTYTTLSEVLADTTTLLALINSNNAVDYMVRSHAWCDDVCADATAMTYIGANNYAADTLLADDNPGLVPTMTSDTTPSGKSSASSVNAISQYTYPAWVVFGGFDMSATTSGNYGTAWQATSNVNEWLEYEFPSATRITMMMFRGLKNTGENYGRVKTYKVQGYDGSSWVDLTENLTCPNTNDGSLPCTPLQKAVFTKNIGDYSKFRIDVIDNYANSADYKIAIKYLQFYAKDGSWLEAICNSTYFESVLNVKVPTMTSAIAPSGEVYSSGDYHANYAAYKAFNGVTSSGGDTNRWLGSTASSGLVKGAVYIAYDFGDGVIIRKVSMKPVTPYSGISAVGSTMVVQGSNSKTTDFVDLYEASMSASEMNTLNDVVFRNDIAYRYHRITFYPTANCAYSGGTYYMEMCELQFYGRAAS